MATRKLGSTKATDTLLITSVNLATEVTGNLPVANLNGGSGASSATFWRGDGTWGTPTGTGDVVGPGSATDNAVARFDLTTGKLIQNSVVIIGDTGAVTGVAALTMTGVLIAGSGPTTITNAAGQVLGAAFADAVQDLFAQVTWGSAGAESSNIIEVPATLQDIAGNTLAVATTEIEVLVSDSATDAEPSATATIAAAGTPVGTLLSGTGTATITMRTSAGGLFTVAITETAAASRFLWVRQGKNSQAFVRANASPKQITFA